MKITPTKGNILAIVLDTTETESGILVQTTRKSNQARIEAIGEGVSDIEPGSKVLFENKAYTEWMEGGKKHMIIKQENILAIIQ